MLGYKSIVTLLLMFLFACGPTDPKAQCVKQCSDGHIKCSASSWTDRNQAACNSLAAQCLNLCRE